MTQELTTTRANHLIDPALGIWHGEVALYLFLGGLVAGLMVLSGVTALRRRSDDPPHSRAALLLPWMAPVLLSLGMFFLFLDLENKPNVWRFYFAFRPASPMSWGAWILIAIYPVAIVHAWLKTPPFAQDAVLRRVRFLQRIANRVAACPIAAPRRIAQLSVFLGILLGVYTGVLLGTLSARPLWSSAILGPLFLTSGISTGAAFTMLWNVSEPERVALSRLDVRLMLLELGLIGMWLAGLMAGGDAARQAAGLVLGGPYTASFWVLVVTAGLVVPIAAEGLELRRQEFPGRFAALLVLGGGLALRWILVDAGQISGWAIRLASR